MNTVSPDEAFQKAINLHRHGDFSRAIDIYRQLLPGFPHNANLLHMYGSAELELGHTDTAISLLRQATAYHPENPVLQIALANGLMLQKHYSEAMASFDRALSLQPGFAPGWFHRGNALAVLGRGKDACADYLRATKLNPQDAGAWEALGRTQLQLGLYQAASDSFSHMISLAPQMAQGYTGRGNAYLQQGKPEEAAADYRMALQYAPKNAGAHFNYALALRALGRDPEALAECSAAICLDPKYAGAYACRGAMHLQMKESEAALADFDAALQLQPDFSKVWCDRGNLMLQMRQEEEALKCFDHAITLSPENYKSYCDRALVKRALGDMNGARADLDQAEAVLDTCGGSPKDRAAIHWNKALIQLLCGAYPEGWSLFESRWDIRQLKYMPEDYAGMPWQGEDISGKTILLHAEQGLGDTLQFVRYVSVVAARASGVILEVPGTLISLMHTLPGVESGAVTLLRQDDPRPAYDVHCPLMSLPHILGTRIDTIPADMPYLRADAAKCQGWQKRLGPKTRPRIGLIWSGRAKFTGDILQADRRRSIPVEQLAPLFDLPFEYHCLQKEIRPQDSESLQKFPQVRTHTEELDDFSDTAALATAMDLIISVDTSVAHLAGALGLGFWVLVARIPDWRWTLAGERTPWYPNARIFRAKTVRIIRATASAHDQPDPTLPPGTQYWPELVQQVSDALQIRFADYIQGL